MANLQSLKLDLVSLTANAGPGSDLIMRGNPNLTSPNSPRPKSILKSLDEYHDFPLELPSNQNFSRETARLGGHLYLGEEEVRVFRVAQFLFLSHVLPLSGVILFGVGYASTQLYENPISEQEARMR